MTEDSVRESVRDERLCGLAGRFSFANSLRVGKALSITVLLWMLPTFLLAQTSDFQVRAAVQVKQDLPKGFDLSLTYQLRRDHNAQAFSGGYSSFDIGYKIGKHLTALGEFRYATSYDWDKFRFGIGFQWKDKLMKKTDYSIKVRYQREHYYQSWPEIGQFPDRNNMRVKLEIERKLVKRLYLHVSAEPQVRIQGREGGFQRVRNIAGLDWEFVKHVHLDLCYYYQPEFKLGLLSRSKHMAVGTVCVDLGKWWKGQKDNE
jgi:hypothetical protein